MSKKVRNFCSDGYFEFWVQNQQKGVKICPPDAPLFLVDWFLTNQVILDIGQVVDKCQCQLMICRGHIRASKGAFQIFCG